MKHSIDHGKRRFLGTSLVLGSSAFGAGALSVPVPGNEARAVSRRTSKAPLFDPTLENYPGYSARIEVSPSMTLQDRGEDGEHKQDSQLFS